MAPCQRRTLLLIAGEELQSYYSTQYKLDYFYFKLFSLVANSISTNYHSFLTHPVSHCYSRLEMSLKCWFNSSPKRKTCFISLAELLSKLTLHRGYKCVAYTIRDSTGYSIKFNRVSEPSILCREASSNSR